MHKNTRFGEYDFVRYFFRKLLLFRYIWCIIRVERYPGGGIRRVIHCVRDCAEPVRVDLQSFRAAQHRGCVQWRCARGCVCSVVAHDSQGTSCASHMRQHVCACITSERSKTRNRPEWRFATGRCGHRPLRTLRFGPYGACAWRVPLRGGAIYGTVGDICDKNAQRAGVVCYDVRAKLSGCAAPCADAG